MPDDVIQRVHVMARRAHADRGLGFYDQYGIPLEDNTPQLDDDDSEVSAYEDHDEVEDILDEDSIASDIAGDHDDLNYDENIIGAHDPGMNIAEAAGARPDPQNNEEHLGGQQEHLATQPMPMQDNMREDDLYPPHGQHNDDVDVNEEEGEQ
jgi:hypothetical protein